LHESEGENTISGNLVATWANGICAAAAHCGRLGSRQGKLPAHETVIGVLSQQIIVTTAQRLLQPPNCCGQNIQLPGLNFLDGAWGKVRQFRQLLLREPGGTPLPTKILTDGF